MNKNKDFNADIFNFPDDYFPEVELPKYDDMGVILAELLYFDFIEDMS